jgi:hypothetical protein
VFENKMHKKAFGPNKDKANGEFITTHNDGMRKNSMQILGQNIPCKKSHFIDRRITLK